jgi:hypothetical protein
MVERPDYQVFGVVTMNDTCSVAGCGNQAVAAFPVRTPQENGVWWLCDRDARAVMSAATGDHSDGRPQEPTRTCGLGEDVPCGALASRVAIVGIRDDQGGRPHLRIVSICQRHELALAGP